MAITVTVIVETEEGRSITKSFDISNEYFARSEAELVDYKPTLENVIDVMKEIEDQIDISFILATD